MRGDMASLLGELKRRNVFRVAFAYLILGWLVLQFTDIVAPALLLPEWTVSLVTFLGIIGFPFAILFTWAFEMTPQGLKRSGEVHPDESITQQTGTTLNRLIFALMALAIIALLVDRFFVIPGMPATEQTPGADTVAEAKPRSIAVLPFVNMSADTDQEYFSDGISEELLNGLARIGDLRVAARTSSFAFKGKNQDITEIGNKLNVETVLEGSVRKSGKRIRITAQLISVEDGYHLWSDTYDRDLTDIFVIQDEISAAIVDALRIHLTDSETTEPRAQAVSEKDVLGYEYFLLARHELRKRLQSSVILAESLYDQSLVASPNFAPALAGKALAVYFNSEYQYGTTPHAEANAGAVKYARQALTLDAELSDAHGILGLVAMDRWELQAAVKYFDHAISINPNQGILYSWRGNALGQLGRADEAREVARQALQLDPLHPVAQSNWMVRLMSEGKFDEIDAFYQSVGEQKPWLIQAMYADTLAQRGQPAAGYLLLQRVQQQSSANQQTHYRLDVYELNNLKQTSLSTTTLPIDRWTMMSRWESPDTITAMAPMMSLSAQSEMEVLLPYAAALIEQGHLDKAWTVLERRNDAQRVPAFPNGTEPSPLRGLTLEALVLQRRGDAKEAERILTELNAFLDSAVANGTNLIQLQRARVYAVGTQPELALDLLEQALALNTLPWQARWNPEFVSLREQPRFNATFDALDAKINSERAKLGWEPAGELRQ
jgi:TolB-like protein